MSNCTQEIPLGVTPEELNKHGDMRLACSPTRYANTVQNLSQGHKDAIQRIGFGGLLQLNPIYLRRFMLVRLAKRYNIQLNCFHICNTDIEMTPSDVNLIMGLPIQGYDANIRTKAQIKQELFQAYQTDNKIKLNTLQDRLQTSTVPDDHFKRIFVLFTIGIILAPTTKDWVHSKYLSLVENVEDISKFNWGHFTLTFLLGSIKKFLSKEEVNLQGNLPLLQFWYWERIQAYSNRGVSYSLIPRPLMARWDEQNARLRDGAYEKDNLDGGVVIMELSVQTASPRNSNTTATPVGTSKKKNNIPAPTMPSHEERQSHQNVNNQDQSELFLSNQQVNTILQFVNNKLLDFETDINRQVLEIQYKLDKKILEIKKELTQIKNECSSMRMELKEIKNQVSNNAPSVPKAVYFKEPSPLGDKKSGSTSHGDESLQRRAKPSYTPTVEASLQTNRSKTPAPKPHIPPRNANFADDYSLNEVDIEVGRFIRMSYKDATVVRVGDHDITVDMLKQTITQKFIMDTVIDAYACISNMENDSTSVLTTFQTIKLTGEHGGIPRGCESPYIGPIANKCIGRDMVFVPMNVCDNHWLLIVLNFKKNEVQVLNSIASNGFRDETKETRLVQSLKACIDDAVDCGLVTIHEPNDITRWKTRCYTNIPQQQDGHSCGAFVLKYMLEWDGEKMTHPFRQTQIDIFRWKICSKLLLSEYNSRRQQSYKQLLTKDEYFAKYPDENPSNDVVNNDDVIEVANPNDATKSKESGSTKRKRGHPKKMNKTTNSTIAQFSTDSIAERVQSNKKRVSKPGPQYLSPYKKP